MVEAEAPGHVVPVQLEGAAIAERRERPQHADAPALRQLRHALGEPVHDLALPGAQPLEVDLGRGEAHTEPLGLPRLADDARGVEQRLGWDAAAEEADAPELRFGVNEGDLDAEVRGPEGGRVTAWPPADDDQLRALHASALQEEMQGILEQLGDVPDEASRVRAIDHAVIVRQGEWKHDPLA